jgi:hypothetical protein
VIWPILSLLAAPPPTCTTADPRVEAVIEARLKETGGSEYCQARLYHTLDDLDGDAREDFVLVFTVEAAAGGNDSVQYLAVFPSASQWTPVIVKVGERGERYIDQIEVDTGRLLVLLTSEYVRGDPMCCPSGDGQLTYKLEKGQLVAVRDAPPNKQMQRTKRG